MSRRAEAARRRGREDRSRLTAVFVFSCFRAFELSYRQLSALLLIMLVCVFAVDALSNHLRRTSH
jgi:ABC-type phosphate/phosphonate transport system permease subunit